MFDWIRSLFLWILSLQMGEEQPQPKRKRGELSGTAYLQREDEVIDEQVQESFDAFVDDLYSVEEKPKHGLPEDDPWMGMEIERARAYREYLLTLREER